MLYPSILCFESESAEINIIGASSLISASFIILASSNPDISGIITSSKNKSNLSLKAALQALIGLLKGIILSPVPSKV